MVAAGIVVAASTKHQLPLLAHLARHIQRVVLAKRKKVLRHPRKIVFAMPAKTDAIKIQTRLLRLRAQTGPHALLVKKKKRNHTKKQTNPF